MALEAEAEIGVICPGSALAAGESVWGTSRGVSPAAPLYVDLLAHFSPLLLSTPPTPYPDTHLPSVPQGSSSPDCHFKPALFPPETPFLGITFQKSGRCPEVQPGRGGFGKLFLSQRSFSGHHMCPPTVPRHHLGAETHPLAHLQGAKTKGDSSRFALFQ